MNVCVVGNAIISSQVTMKQNHNKYDNLQEEVCGISVLNLCTKVEVQL